MTTKLRLLVACGFLLSLSACVESEHPISSVSTAQQDTRLYGLWMNSGEGRTSYVLIGAEADEPTESGGRAAEPGMMRYWSLEQIDADHKLTAPSGAQFYCTKIGSDDFATWITPVEKDEPAKPTTYFFLKYRVEENRLSIWLQDPEKTAEAIEAGKVKGIVKRKPKTAFFNPNGVESVRVTDTSENIRAFLAAGGATSCFPDDNKIDYERVR